jgi:hypothetical protein
MAYVKKNLRTWDFLNFILTLGSPIPDNDFWLLKGGMGV